MTVLQGAINPHGSTENDSGEEVRHQHNVAGSKKAVSYHDNVLEHIKGSKQINDMKSELSESCSSMYMYDGGDKISKKDKDKDKKKGRSRNNKNDES